MKKIERNSWPVIMSTLFLMFFLQACTLQEDELPQKIEEEQYGEEDVTVLFSLNRTRSSITADEGKINDINLFVYSEGELTAHVWSDKNEDIALNMDRQKTYNLYAISNAGKIEGIVTEQEFTAGAEFRISRMEELQNGFPMVWKRIGFRPSEGPGRQQVAIRLQKLVSRLELSIDKGVLSDLEITSVQLCQSASSVHPFREGGSRITTSGDVIQGDRASATDLEKINTGGSISMYTLENMQGVLLPGNTDPWKKIPDNIPEKEDVCTYVEIKGRFKEQGMISGSVTYRFYPGKDNCTDFNIGRNTLYRIQLMLSGDIIGKLTWKLDSDITVGNGYVWGEMESGGHPMNGMYTGEHFRFSYEVHDKFTEHFGGDISGCRLVFIPEEGKGEIIFSVPVKSNVKNRFLCEADCLSAGNGSIWITEPDGKKFMPVCNGVSIQNPVMVFSLEEGSRYYEPVPALDEAAIIDINTHGTDINLFLTDREGYNLNQSGSEFNLDLFSFAASDKGDIPGLEEFVSMNSVSGTPCSDGPAAKIHLQCMNEGDDRRKNELLCRTVGNRGSGCITLTDASRSMAGHFYYDLLPPTITMTLVDNGWAGYFNDSQLSLILDNPSRLPLEIDVWQIITSYKRDYGTVTPIDLKVTRHDYIYRNYPLNGQQPTFGSHCHITDSEDALSDPCITDGKNKIYRLEELNTNDLIRGAASLGYGSDALLHFISINTPYGKLPSYRIRASDRLSDGSSKYEEIYGPHGNEENPLGWNDQGIWLYTENYCVSKPHKDMDQFGITPELLERLVRDEEPVELEMIWNRQTRQACIRNMRPAAAKGASVDTYIYGTMYGYVKTHPKGTHRKGVDNYCNTPVHGSAAGIPLSGAVAGADGNTIQEAMDDIYRHTYLDSWNQLNANNTYQHPAHPTETDLCIQFKIPSADHLYPFTLKNNLAIRYNHVHEAMNYDVTARLKSFNSTYVHVEKLLNRNIPEQKAETEELPE